MGTKTESSVLMNLNDLFEMEAQRRVDEAAAKERAVAEAAAREVRERAEREAAIRAAREEERRQADAELEANRALVETRIATLKDELEQVRAAREQTRLQLLEMATRNEAPRSNRGSWIAGAMAALSLIAAITATFVAWPHQEVPVAPAVTVVAPVETAPVAPVDAIVDEPPVAEVVAEVVPEAPVAAPSRPGRPRTPRPPRHDAHQDLASQLDFGTGDGLIPE